MKIFLTYLRPEGIDGFRLRWAAALSDRVFRRQLALTTLFLGALALFIPRFFAYIQDRAGFVPEDLLLAAIPAGDWSLLVFVLIYASVFIALFSIGLFPHMLLRALQAYCFLTLLRVACLYLVPLDPHPDIIPLQDPFVGHLFYRGEVITKDLFFSGHVSTLALTAFLTVHRPFKLFIVAATFAVAVLILFQHVHYTVDVLAAPLFAWFSYFSVGRWMR